MAPVLLLTALAAACSAGLDTEDEAGNKGNDLDDNGDGVADDLGSGDADGDGEPGNPVPQETGIVPLYNDTTPLEIEVLEEKDGALITRFGDRGRDRHAREDEYKTYDHYLKMYWEHRTVNAEIVDTVARDGDAGSITFNVTTEFKLHDDQAELRFFYEGMGTVAQYRNNGVMTPIDDLHYTRSVSINAATGEPLKVGDEMEFELSQFLDPAVEAFGGRANYYGTTYLYVVGKGLIPWQANAGESDACPCLGEISYPIPEKGWLGGRTTLPYQYSDEPEDHFMQMATNLAGNNAQPFVLGRRAVHTDFEDGHHNEDPANPYWTEQAGKLGPLYINESCDACHHQNTRSLPPEVGSPLAQYVIKVGAEDGSPDPYLGSVFQPGEFAGYAEGTAVISGWTESDGLRTPTYSFTGTTPTNYSPRAAPQLVGMGLLEAILESDLIALSDPDDGNGDGISGRVRVVTDPVSGQARLGRFGWKGGQASVRHQVAAALQTDMGVLTSVFPNPDCGAEQEDCGGTGAEFNDTDLENLTKYISLLGIRARRDLESSQALQGEELFDSIGCADCHVTTFVTSQYHPFAELRNQTVHPYTDLLLHDMGPGLADNLPEGTLKEGNASGSEWRTAPLWSVGLTRDVKSGTEAYLHDGRARTLEEAIRWHGGEGQTSNDAYMALPQGDRDALLAFLRSL